MERKLRVFCRECGEELEIAKHADNELEVKPCELCKLSQTQQVASYLLETWNTDRYVGPTCPAAMLHSLTGAKTYDCKDEISCSYCKSRVIEFWKKEGYLV